MYENQKIETGRPNRKKTNLINSLNETDKYAIDLASEKGASNCVFREPLRRFLRFFQKFSEISNNKLIYKT